MTNTDCRILCGDAADVLRTLPSDSIQLTFTSPPYYRHRDYGVDGQIGREKALADYVARMAEVLNELLRVTRTDGTCFIVIGDTYLNRKLLLVPHRVALAATDVGWCVRNDIILSKLDPAPESPRNRWRNSHEHILFLSKRPTGYFFDPDSIRIPYSAETLRRWGNGQVYGGRKSSDRSNDRDSRMRHGKSFRLHPRGCIPPDVWSLATGGSSRSHYAGFSPELVRRAVGSASRPRDMVLDPFCGIGTTCSVAAEEDRRWIGIELNPQYVAEAIARVPPPRKERLEQSTE